MIVQIIEFTIAKHMQNSLAKHVYTLADVLFYSLNSIMAGFRNRYLG